MLLLLDLNDPSKIFIVLRLTGFILSTSASFFCTGFVIVLVFNLKHKKSCPNIRATFFSVFFPADNQFLQ